MKHFGDITKLSGYELPVVDVITGGSPCQDLSVAGRREGLAGERSGLFMEQMRIVKEMRDNDKRIGRTGWAVRPRYMVWENVLGAFSSGKPKGSDFAAVIEEIIKVADPGTSVHVSVPDRGWPKSGCYYAEDGSWSIAWRVHDAQFWGVPQRRKRIALVADFGGLSAPEILFERKGMRGDPAESGASREETARAAGGGAESASGTISFQERAGKPGGGKGILIQHEHVGALSTLNNQSVLCLNDQGGSVMGVSEDVTGALRAQEHGHQPILLESNQNHATVQTDGISTALPASMGMGGGYVPMVTFVYDARGNGDGEIAPTMTGDHQNRVTDYTTLCVGNGQLNQVSMAEQANTLDTMHDQQAIITYGIDRAAYNQGQNAKYDFSIEKELIGAQTARGPGAVYNSIVRRLTPLECERLQGFPDGWTDIGEWMDSKGKKHKDADSPRYKALGNSIALPFWAWLARRICAQYERPVTMGSLFDGIGGFPLVFERCGAKAVWASEIEEFCIAVTKVHFPEE